MGTCLFQQGPHMILWVCSGQQEWARTSPLFTFFKGPLVPHLDKPKEAWLFPKMAMSWFPAMTASVTFLDRAYWPLPGHSFLFLVSRSQTAVPAGWATEMPGCCQPQPYTQWPRLPRRGGRRGPGPGKAAVTFALAGVHIAILHFTYTTENRTTENRQHTVVSTDTQQATDSRQR